MARLRGFGVGVDGVVVGFGADRCILRDGVYPMREPRDFAAVPLASIRILHREATGEDFAERLAWRIAREEKLGYSEAGFEEERDTWRIKSADTADVHDLLRRSRRRVF